MINNKKVTRSLQPNINELDELPFLQHQQHSWKHFDDKQKFLPTFRSISHQHQSWNCKILLFSLNLQRKGNKAKRVLKLITEPPILTLEKLFPMMMENLPKQQFSPVVATLKHFETTARKCLEGLLKKNYIFFQGKSDWLSFAVYKEKEGYCVKARFNHMYYEPYLDQTPGPVEQPAPFVISSLLLVQALDKQYEALHKLSQAQPLKPEVQEMYKAFYDQVYFSYDDFILKLQIYHNFPLLRVKNFLPVRFNDLLTGQPLEGPIYSNADMECMYSHFSGYSADSSRQVVGTICEASQIMIHEVQENQLLMMLRDNVCNPRKLDLFYCPQFNRFKLIIPGGGFGSIGYLNYYHFRINLRKTTTKDRIKQYPPKDQEFFPLTFKFNGQTQLIMDPARGRNCSHAQFTDLRLYYQSFDPVTRLYSCPVHGCEETMTDNDILYLKEAQVLMQYAAFKCEQHPNLLSTAEVTVNHPKEKVYMIYKTKEKGALMAKMDEIPAYYKSFYDPYVHFSDWNLGMKERDRKKKMDEYLYRGMQQQNQEVILEEEQEEQDFDHDE